MQPGRANTQMFALCAGPPKQIRLIGGVYRLVKVFKHDFFAATCLYEAEEDAPTPKIVVKFGRSQPFCGIPMRWYGRWLQRHEQDIYQTLTGIEGIPAWIGRVDETGYAIEYIDAKPLDHCETTPAECFDRLRSLFDAIHKRGVAICDANKRSNILIGPDDRPYLVDYQISFRRRDDWPWPASRLVAHAVAYMAAKDLYHLYKHKRRMCRDALTAEEETLSRKRGFLHRLHRRIMKPLRQVRRSVLRRQYRKGKLVSPTAELEDHYQPEKSTWRR